MSDYPKSKAFYLTALAPLGYELVTTITPERVPDLPFDEACGLGIGGKPTFWIRPTQGPIAPTHVAFAAKDRPSVDAFHGAALGAGGTDHGEPGLRHYHPQLLRRVS